MKRLIIMLAIIVLNMSVYAENKYALLISNSKYKNFSSLDGPVKEARDLSIVLKSLGFTVELLENGTREQMLDELDSIKQNINGKGGIALFHFGGHGVQAQGKNYLIPVDADIPDEKKLSTRAVDIDEVMSSLDLSGSDTNIVILDACRNNPLSAGSGRSASRGLSVIGVKPKNSIIVYSAEAGTVAQDGLFTPTLTKLLSQKEKSLNQILMEVRREVNILSNYKQLPGEYNQLFQDIYLNAINTNIVNNGKIKNKGEGYLLYWDGILVRSDSEVNYIDAEINYAWNCYTYKDKKIEAYYNGNKISITSNGYTLYWDGLLVGHSPDWSFSEAVANYKWNRNKYPEKNIKAYYNEIEIK